MSLQGDQVCALEAIIIVSVIVSIAVAVTCQENEADERMKTAAASKVLQRGDIITSISGRNVRGMSVLHAKDLIMGPEGSNVVLGVHREARGAQAGSAPGEFFEVNMTRASHVPASRDNSRTRYSQSPAMPNRMQQRPSASPMVQNGRQQQAFMSPAVISVCICRHETCFDPETLLPPCD